MNRWTRPDQLADDRHRALRPLPAGGEARQRRHVDRLPGPRRRRSTAPVAVKVMHREMSEQADQLERFRQEARAVAKLSHPNVVAVIDAGEDGGHPYIVFEYVEGETLKQRIARVGALDTAGGARLRDRDRPRPHRRPRAQHGPPRHQAAERPDRRRGPGEADRLRHLPPARAGRDDRHRPRPRHHRLRRPRAGDGPRRSTSAPTSTRSASSSTRC